MIRSELIAKIAEENPHLFQRDVEKIVNTIFDEIIEASEEECRLYQEAYEAEFQMQLDLITDRYNRLQKIKLVSDSDREPTA